MPLTSAFYVHWPYCEAKCPYCDFNSHLSKNLFDNEQDYLKALLIEIESYTNIYGTRTLSSIYFGGGTPSLMSENTIEAILNHIAKYYNFTENIEITIEVNPSSFMRKKLLKYKELGINRVSIGIQSFNSEALKKLGRIHNVVEAEQALICAQEIFDNYSFDLIYARAEQTIQEWEEELYHGLSFNAPHMSLYELTIEPGTKFATLVNNGKMKVVSNEVGAEFYQVTQKIMNEAFMPAYEVSNHAKVNCESKHNLAYWQYKEYIGVGPGAHSRIWVMGTPAIIAQSNIKQPNLWQKRIVETGLAIEHNYKLEQKEQAEELILNSMRTRKGLNLTRFELLYGDKLNFYVIEQLIAEQLLEAIPTIEYKRNQIRPTEKGLLFVDYIVRQLTNL